MIEIKDIEKLADLARLEVPQEEKEGLKKDLNSILEYVGQIKEAHTKSAAKSSVKSDTSGGAAGSGADSAFVRNVLRADENPHKSGIFSEKLLASVPQTEDEYVKVKKIL